MSGVIVGIYGAVGIWIAAWLSPESKYGTTGGVLAGLCWPLLFAAMAVSYVIDGIRHHPWTKSQ